MNNGERVLFVHAHPHDVAFTSGGTIAALISAGSDVVVTLATGAEDHLRVAEVMRELGVDDYRFLGASDARWENRAPRRYLGHLGDEGQSPESLARAPFGEVSADIAAVIAAVAPTVVVSMNEWAGGDPDHIRVHQAARRAAEVMGVAFYVVELEESAATPTVVSDVSAFLDRKQRAVAAHFTDAGVGVDGSTTPPKEITRVEYFRRIREPQPESFAWRGLTLTSKISTSVLALVLGGATGLLMTAAHQSTIVIGTVPVPWGIVVALVSSIALVAGFRMAFDTRVLPALAAFGLLVVAGILASPTRGGSVVVPANLVGVLWTFVPPAVAFIVLAWPRIRRAPAGRIEPVPAVKGSSIP